MDARIEFDQSGIHAFKFNAAKYKSLATNYIKRWLRAVGEKSVK
jgi:hypothetical protein